MRGLFTNPSPQPDPAVVSFSAEGCQYSVHAYGDGVVIVPKMQSGRPFKYPDLIAAQHAFGFVSKEPVFRERIGGVAPAAPQYAALGTLTPAAITSIQPTPDRVIG